MLAERLEPRGWQWPPVLPLDGRLRALREKTRAELVKGRGFVIYGAIMVALPGLFILPLTLFTAGSQPSAIPYSTDPVDLYFRFLMIMISVGFWGICGCLLGYPLAVACLTPRIEDYHYHQMWQYLLHTDIGVALASDEYHRLAAALLSRGSVVKLEGRSLSLRCEQQMLRSCLLLPLYFELLRNPELQRSRLTRALRYMAQVDSLFSIPGWLFYGGTLLFYGTMSLGFLCCVLVLSHGPIYLGARGRLLALIDYLLDEPRFEPASIEPPFQPLRATRLIDLLRFRPPPRVQRFARR